MASRKLDRGVKTPRAHKGEEVRSPEGRGGPLPTFLIIGAMKSGTTALARYLDAHPEVYLARQKGTNFFDREYEKGLDWYGAQFSDGITKAAIGEATPLYMYDARALERMARVLPNAKLIAILRNPVDRAYSHFWHERSRRREKLGFAEALRAEPDRISQSEHYRRHFAYRDLGRYAKQLVEVARYYPRDRINVLIYEDFFSSVTDYYRQLCRYLDIDETVLPPLVGERFGVRTAIRSERLRQISNRMNGTKGRFLRRLNVAREIPRPPMDPSIRGQLLADFQSDNERLANWLGLNLKAWSE